MWRQTLIGLYLGGIGVLAGQQLGRIVNHLWW